MTTCDLPVAGSSIENRNALSGILVMPDNMLHNLLQSVRDRIPEDDLLITTCDIGFYSETFSAKDGNYHSFDEVFTGLVRGLITQKNDFGPLKVLKSRGGYLSGHEGTTNIRFSGGVFISTSYLVKKTTDFIVPSSFV